MNLVEQLGELARRHQVPRIASVELEVGALLQVVPEALETAFAAAAAGTPAAGARLVLSEMPGAAVCRSCGREFGVSVSDFVCPNCGQADARVTAGRDLLLRSIECPVPAGADAD